MVLVLLYYGTNTIILSFCMFVKPACNNFFAARDVAGQSYLAHCGHKLK